MKAKRPCESHPLGGPLEMSDDLRLMTVGDTLFLYFFMWGPRNMNHLIYSLSGSPGMREVVHQPGMELLISV